MENNNNVPFVSNSGPENKYLVFEYSSNIYKDIRQYLKQESGGAEVRFQR